MEKSFLVKIVGLLGGDPGDLQEIRILNRIVTWTREGLRYESDPRHGEILMQALLGSGRPVSTPGVKGEGKRKGVRFEEEEEEPDSGGGVLDVPLTEEEAKLFRSGAARANYLSLDRPDMSFATKELCRRMSGPLQQDLEGLRRIAGYLAGSPRVVYDYPWQPEPGLSVYADTDFAGCLVTRRSTSGGCALRGRHLVKHWSSTQKVVTLSSGEAELAGVVKAVGEALGLQSLGRDLGLEMGIEVHADSSAAVGMCRRSGIGKVRHLAVGQLWVQERLRMGDFRLFKVAGNDNPADALTKHLSRNLLDQHLGAMSVLRLGGRAASAPKVAAAIDDSLASTA